MHICERVSSSSLSVAAVSADMHLLPGYSEMGDNAFENLHPIINTSPILQHILFLTLIMDYIAAVNLRTCEELIRGLSLDGKVFWCVTHVLMAFPWLRGAEGLISKTDVGFARQDAPSWGIGSMFAEKSGATVMASPGLPLSAPPVQNGAKWRGAGPCWPQWQHVHSDWCVAHWKQESKGKRGNLPYLMAGKSASRLCEERLNCSSRCPLVGRVQWGRVLLLSKICVWDIHFLINMPLRFSCGMSIIKAECANPSSRFPKEWRTVHYFNINAQKMGMWCRFNLLFCLSALLPRNPLSRHSVQQSYAVNYSFKILPLWEPRVPACTALPVFIHHVHVWFSGKWTLRLRGKVCRQAKFVTSSELDVQVQRWTWFFSWCWVVNISCWGHGLCVYMALIPTQTKQTQSWRVHRWCSF